MTKNKLIQIPYELFERIEAIANLNNVSVNRQMIEFLKKSTEEFLDNHLENFIKQNI